MDIFSARTSITRRARAAVVGVALVLALGACGASSKPQTTAQLLQQALREHVAGDLPQAESDFIEVIRRDPKNKFAYYNLGLIYQTQGENTDAESPVPPGAHDRHEVRAGALQPGDPPHRGQRFRWSDRPLSSGNRGEPEGRQCPLQPWAAAAQGWADGHG